jgi:hypothetical protein
MPQNRESEMTTAMNRHARRKAHAKKRKFHRMPDGRKVAVTETINLSDPNLDPEHRAIFIRAIRGEFAQLDEAVANWYRHRGEATKTVTAAKTTWPRWRASCATTFGSSRTGSEKLLSTLTPTSIGL